MDSTGIAMTILNLLNILFHGSGIYILVRLKNSGISYSQRILITTLSVSEILFGVNKLISYLIFDRYYQHDFIKKIFEMFSLTTVSFLYFSAMILITLDRLLEFHLNLKYHLYWSGKKTIWSIGVCIVISVIVFIVFLSLFIAINLDFKRVLYIYFYPVFELFFTVLAFGTYTYIFIVYRQKKQKPTPNLKHTDVNKKLKPIFKIYVPFLIMITFVLFLVVPDTVYFISYFSDCADELVNNALMLLYRIGFLLDALIYIFCSKPVRRKIKIYWKRYFLD